MTDVESRLENWGRWARSGMRGTSGRVASAEGRYRPERGDLDAERERAALPQIDPHDASRVDAAIAPAAGFPIRWMLLLREQYVFLADRYATCRRLRIRPANLDEEIRKAVVAAENVLTRRAR